MLNIVLCNTRYYFLYIYLHSQLMSNTYNMNQENQNNNALIIHLSALSNLFIPLGNLILPIIFWQSFKKDNTYIDHHGKEAVNFNLSFFIYSIVIVGFIVASVLGTIFNAIELGQMENSEKIFELLFSTGGFLISLLLLAIFAIVKFILIIIAAVKAGQGELFRYPLTIRFIK